MIVIRNITFSIINAANMVPFYNAVLGAGLEPIQGMEGFFRGKLGQLSLLMCPVAVSGVEAKQNRQQLGFVVPNLQHAIDAGLANGGRLIGDDFEENEFERKGYLYDPDGNSLELIQLK
ncbi:MAG: VOC family protein [Chloroflexota bacterium]